MCFFNNRKLAPPLRQSDVLITATTLPIKSIIDIVSRPFQSYSHQVISVLYSPEVSRRIICSCTLRLVCLTRYSYNNSNDPFSQIDIAHLVDSGLTYINSHTILPTDAFEVALTNLFRSSSPKVYPSSDISEYKLRYILFTKIKAIL
jgi:hypothetical protein